ncbi:MAG: hypothetical protein WBG42_14235 [Cryomorphaceae bacterium]
MKSRLVVFALISFVWLSCEKDDDNVDCVSTQDPDGSVNGNGGNDSFEYVNSIGSYWVYQWYKVPYDGMESQLTRTDSIWIAGDTLINGNEYAVLKGTFYAGPEFTRFERDSSGYIINHRGDIFWSYTNFTDTLNTGFNGVWDYYTKMESSYVTFTPVGPFVAIKRNLHLYYTSGEPANQCGEDQITLTQSYASGVGLVKEQLGYAGPLTACANYDEARLTDYYIAP